MIVHSEQEMLDFGADFAKSMVKPASIIELVGDVGAGKTTFTRGLAAGLGITKTIASPSFTIAKSYALPNGKGHLIHYDFYRLSDPGLMFNDFHESLDDPANIIVVEWADSVSNLLPDNRIIIHIKKTDDNSRTIIIKDNRTITLQDHSQLASNESNAKTIPITTKHHEQTKKGIVRLSLDTSTPTTILRINDNEYQHNFGHDLAEQLLQFIYDKLTKNQYSWHDITEIEFMSGPGSFTGLRIGASIVNTLAHELNIPLTDHHNHQCPIIIPDYGRAAHITPPRK